MSCADKPDLARFASGELAPEPLPLRTEAEVMSSWRRLRPPEVSICCAVYNHRPYIESALRGFLAQVTDFPFEIVVRDDASNDGTTALLREYASRYPAIIRLRVEKQNTYRLGAKPTFALTSLARGFYIALCEGDDYWITSDKLQKQYDLLVNHPLSPMCVAWTVKCQQNNYGVLRCDSLLNDTDNFSPLRNWRAVTADYFHTSTFLCRAEALRSVMEVFSALDVRRYFSDTPLQHVMADRGPLVVLPEVVSVYRLTGGGIWTSLNSQRKLEWDIGCNRFMLKYFVDRQRHYYGRILLDLHLLMLLQGRLAYSGRGRLQNLYEFMRLLRYFPELLRYAIRRRWQAR